MEHPQAPWPVEAAPIIDGGKNRLLSWKRQGLAYILGAVASISANTNIAHADHQISKKHADTWVASPMQEVGVDDNNSWWSDNPAVANSTVALAQSLNFGALRNIVPVVQNASRSEI